MKRLCYTLLLTLLMSTSVFAQQVSVPISDHTEDQQIQGPCYLFAMMAAVESRALQNQANFLSIDNNNRGKVNFNEWLYYSKSALEDYNFTAPSMMLYSLKHFTNYDAVNFYDTDNWIHPAPNPSYYSENGSGPLAWIPKLHWMAEFNDCPDWSHNAMAYKEPGSEQGIVGDYTPMICHDISTPGRPFEIIPTQTINNNYYRFVPNQLPTFENENVYHVEIGITATDITQAIDNGDGVIAVFNNWLNTGWSGCIPGNGNPTSVQADEHAVFIYGYDQLPNGSIRFYYKDSWPSDPAMPGSGYQNDPSSRFGTFMSNLLTTYCIGRNFILDGTVEANNPPVPPSCDVEIEGDAQVVGHEVYQLDAPVDVVTWILPSELTFVNSTSNDFQITVASTGCYTTETVNIRANYMLGAFFCTDIIPVTINPPISIQLNGPVGGMSQVCPNSAFQLEAINADPTEIIDYEWEVLSGATILNGQGTKYLNVQAWNTPSAYQSYRLRVRKTGCDWTEWLTMTGYIRESCGGRGGGVGIFRTVQTTPKELEFKAYFNAHQNQGNVEIEVLTVTGQVLLKTKATPANTLVKLVNLPAGIVLLRMYNKDTGAYEVKRHIIAY